MPPEHGRSGRAANSEMVPVGATVVSVALRTFSPALCHWLPSHSG